MQDEQRQLALRKANAVRRERMLLREAVAAGQRDPVELLTNPPESCARVTVNEFLTWPRRWGTARARRALVTAQVGETKALGQLTERARAALASQLLA